MLEPPWGPQRHRMKLALIFDHFGPYHRLRLRAAAGRMDATGVECHSRSRDYAWNAVKAEGPPIVTVMEEAQPASAKEPTGSFSSRLGNTLAKLEPDVVAIPGWSAVESLAALRWCLRHSVPAVLMSESSMHDEPRRWWKEAIKRQLITLFAAGLVGGSQHRIYLEALGMGADAIFPGYDVVDNTYFSEATGQIRANQTREDAPHENTKSFLASARFVEKKNLHRLLDAFASYRKQAEAGKPGPHWTLTLLGDGPLRASLEQQIRRLGLGEFVTMPGFLQYEDLPRFYAGASAFIHASTTEQWGLVVNEAMAAGLPVLVSNRCGCALDLVQEGVNGFTFDPFDVELIARAMLRMAELPCDQRAMMGHASEKHISLWGPDRFADGLTRAANKAKANGPKSCSPLNGGLLAMLSMR
jgi:glycosyltransferase involved in cell wall biosynthesis